MYRYKVSTRKGGRYVRAPSYPWTSIRAPLKARRKRTGGRRPRKYPPPYITRSSRMPGSRGNVRFWYRYPSRK